MLSLEAALNHATPRQGALRCQSPSAQPSHPGYRTPPSTAIPVRVPAPHAPCQAATAAAASSSSSRPAALTATGRSQEGSGREERTSPAGEPLARLQRVTRNKPPALLPSRAGPPYQYLAVECWRSAGDGWSGRQWGDDSRHHLRLGRNTPGLGWWRSRCPHPPPAQRPTAAPFTTISMLNADICQALPL